MDSTQCPGNQPCAPRFHGDNHNTSNYTNGALSINMAQKDFLVLPDTPNSWGPVKSDEEIISHSNKNSADCLVAENTKPSTSPSRNPFADRYVGHVNVVVTARTNEHTWSEDEDSSSFEIISEGSSLVSVDANHRRGDRLDRSQMIKSNDSQHFCRCDTNNFKKSLYSQPVNICCTNRQSVKHEYKQTHIKCCDNGPEVQYSLYSSSDKTDKRCPNKGGLHCYQYNNMHCSSECYSTRDCSRSMRALDLKKPDNNDDNRISTQAEEVAKNQATCDNTDIKNVSHQCRWKSIQESNTSRTKTTMPHDKELQNCKASLDNNNCCQSPDHVSMFKSIPNLCYTNRADDAGDLTCSTLNLLHSSVDSTCEEVNFDKPPVDTVSLPADVEEYTKHAREQQNYCQGCQKPRLPHDNDAECNGNNTNICAEDEEPTDKNYQRSFSEPVLVRQRRMRIYGIAQRQKRIWYRRKLQPHRGSIVTSTLRKTETERETESFSLTRLSRNDKLMLLCLALSNLCAMLCMSVIAPFFPREALEKGVHQNISGWIFGVFSLTEVLVAPIFGRLVNHVSPRFMFLSGQFFAGSCYILFGFLEYVPTQESNLVFIILCFILRIFTAVGTTAMATSSFTIIASVFGDYIATVFGILETTTGLGLSLGPALGGILYDAGGFMLPFLSLGCFMVFLVPIMGCLLPVIQEDESSDVSHNQPTIMKLVRIPAIFITCVCTFVAALVWATPDPVLSLHLAGIRGHDLSSTMIGLMFLLLSACYGIFCPIWGWLCDKLENTTPMLILGFLLSGLGVMLLGPSPYFGLQADYNELWLNIVALIVMGIALSLAIVPTFERIVDTAERAGFEENVETYGVVAGLWASCYALGDFVGPTLGGFLTSQYSFPWCMTFIAYCCGVMAIILICLWICEKKMHPMFCVESCSCCKGQNEIFSGHKDPADYNEDETKGLLNDQHTRYGTQDSL